MIALVILYALIALSFVLAKKALLYADPYVLIGIRMLVAGSLLLGYECLIKKTSLKIPRVDVLLFIGITFFHIYFAFVPEFWALQYVSALKTTLLYSCTPFVTALLSRVLLAERLLPRQWLGMCVGFFSLCPLILGPSVLQACWQDLVCVSVPDMVLMFAIVSACYAWFLVKKLLHKGYSLPMINGTSMIGGGLLSLLTAVFMGSFKTTPVSDWSQFMLWTGLLIVLANGVVYNLYGALMRTYSLTLITFAGFLSPIFGALFDFLINGTMPDMTTYAALVGITVGLYLFTGAHLYTASPATRER